VRVAYFGLPLGALLLLGDGVDVRFAALSPVAAPGLRRLRRRLGPSVIVAGRDEAAFQKAIDAAFEREKPELVVSWFFTRKLEHRWIAPPLVAIGAHPSLLPRHRGPDPFFWAIDSGDLLTGVTVHHLVDGYDEGDMLQQESLPILDRNAWELARALDRVSLRNLRAVTRRFVDGEPPAATPQDESLATWAGAPTDAEQTVDFRWTTERVLRRIRALSPVPGLALEIRGACFFVTRASSARDFPEALLPGEASLGDEGVAIRTRDGAVRLERAVSCDGPEAEPDGREMSARDLLDFLRQRPH
jgi:methionyl-tRNA formyltransferase